MNLELEVEEVLFLGRLLNNMVKNGNFNQSGIDIYSKITDKIKDQIMEKVPYDDMDMAIHYIHIKDLLS